MANSRYDVHIGGPVEDESSIVLLRFPAMRSQFENRPEQIHLNIKPKSMKLRLEVDLDSNSNEFCKQQAQSLALKSAAKTFPNGLVNKSYYSSTETPVDDGQLFICKLVNNKLVCCPISHFLILRPDFSHFDQKDEVDPKEEVRPVSVKFAAPERLNAPSKSRDNNDESDDPLEEFQSLKYRTSCSREAIAQRATLFGESKPKIKPDPDGVPVDSKPELVFPPDVKPKIEKMDIDDIYSSDMSSGQSSPKKSNQIKQRVKECLTKAKIASFEEVYNFLKHHDADVNGQTPQISNKDILDSLSELALLVQGNWAIKSEILYGDSSERDCTDVTGISINLFIAARDYLLWLFTQKTMVSRLEFSRRVKIPDCDILDLFKQLATYKKDVLKWELKLPPDNRFIEKFPEIVQRQITIWKVRKANKLSIFER